MYTTQKVHHQEHYGVRPLRPLILLCYAAARLKQFLLRDIKTCRTPTESYYRSFNVLKPMEILVNNITITQCIRYSNDPLACYNRMHLLSRMLVIGVCIKVWILFWTGKIICLSLPVHPCLACPSLSSTYVPVLN